jgi:hypothetical protein
LSALDDSETEHGSQLQLATNTKSQEGFYLKLITYN